MVKRNDCAHIAPIIWFSRLTRFEIKLSTLFFPQIASLRARRPRSSRSLIFISVGAKEYRPRLDPLTRISRFSLSSSRKKFSRFLARFRSPVTFRYSIRSRHAARGSSNVALRIPRFDGVHRARQCRRENSSSTNVVYVYTHACTSTRVYYCASVRVGL